MWIVIKIFTPALSQLWSLARVWCLKERILLLKLKDMHISLLFYRFGDNNSTSAPLFKADRKVSHTFACNSRASWINIIIRFSMQSRLWNVSRGRGTDQCRCHLSLTFQQKSVSSQQPTLCWIWEFLWYPSDWLKNGAYALFYPASRSKLTWKTDLLWTQERHLC